MTGAPTWWHHVLSSTIDEAHRQAAAGAPDGTAVVARRQSAARGTRGKDWSSPLGGLWMSVIVRPATAGIECLSLRIGLAVAERLEPWLPPGTALALKWPNDLLIDGRKVAGVLCEARWQADQVAWVIASIGLNLKNPLPPDLAPTATRLADHGVTAGAEELAGPVREAIAEAGRRTGPLTDGELAAFAARDWLRGRRLAPPEAGRADGITETGRLRIRSEDGTVATTMGPVRVTEG